MLQLSLSDIVEESEEWNLKEAVKERTMYKFRSFKNKGA